MKKAVYELQAYYGKNLSETVSKIHLEGQDAPWKPATDNHYCIDPIEYVEENKQRQAVANLPIIVVLVQHCCARPMSPTNL